MSKKEVSDILFKDESEFYLKKDSSSQGKGVVKITYNDFDTQDLFSYGDSLIQESINQSDWFNQIITGSVATIRITTVKGNDSQIRKLAAYLRVGRKGSELVKAKETIRIPIVDDNGIIGEFGSDKNWKRHYKHPDTGFVFGNQKIPYFAKAVRECEKIHKSLPHFSIIGWDVSITNNGEIKIMEWNAGHPDIKFTEASTGPNFTDLGWEKLWK